VPDAETYYYTRDSTVIHITEVTRIKDIVAISLHFLLWY